MLNKIGIAKRIGQELRDGWYVNLGIGIPTHVLNFIPEGIEVTLQSENGMLGMGPFPTEENIDADLINAGKQTITELPQTSYFDSATSFGMIRGGKIAMAILGAMEVAQNGDLAANIRLLSQIRGQTAVRNLDQQHHIRRCRTFTAIPSW